MSGRTWGGPSALQRVVLDFVRPDASILSSPRLWASVRKSSLDKLAYRGKSASEQAGQARWDHPRSGLLDRYPRILHCHALEERNKGIWILTCRPTAAAISNPFGSKFSSSESQMYLSWMNPGQASSLDAPVVLGHREKGGRPQGNTENADLLPSQIGSLPEGERRR